MCSTGLAPSYLRLLCLLQLLHFFFMLLYCHIFLILALIVFRQVSARLKGILFCSEMLHNPAYVLPVIYAYKETNILKYPGSEIKLDERLFSSLAYGKIWIPCSDQLCMIRFTQTVTVQIFLYQFLELNGFYFFACILKWMYIACTLMICTVYSYLLISNITLFNCRACMYICIYNVCVMYIHMFMQFLSKKLKTLLGKTPPAEIFLF